MRPTSLLPLPCLLLVMPTWSVAAPAPVKRFSPDTVIMETSLGRIKIRLFPEKAPLTVASFLRYVDDKFYDNTIFHRVIPNFMIQGGGFDTAFTQKKARDPIKNEADNGLSNKRGTLAAARAAAPDSATCQFYINVKDNTFLDSGADDPAKGGARLGPGYCVFGEVIEGMDVIDKITRVATGNRGIHQNVPVENVIIKSVRRAPR